MNGFVAQRFGRTSFKLNEKSSRSRKSELFEGEAFRSFPNTLVFRWERILVAGRILSVVFYLRGVATAANREVSTNSSPRGDCTVIGP